MWFKQQYKYDIQILPVQRKHNTIDIGLSHVALSNDPMIYKTKIPFYLLKRVLKLLLCILDCIIKSFGKHTDGALIFHCNINNSAC